MDEIEPHWIRWPYARIRRELRTESGEIVRFVVQLEYDVEAEIYGGSRQSWHVVARFERWHGIRGPWSSS